jgi:hypothetical protein
VSFRLLEPGGERRFGDLRAPGQRPDALVHAERERRGGVQDVRIEPLLLQRDLVSAHVEIQTAVEDVVHGREGHQALRCGVEERERARPRVRVSGHASGAAQERDDLRRWMLSSLFLPFAEAQAGDQKLHAVDPRGRLVRMAGEQSRKPRDLLWLEVAHRHLAVCARGHPCIDLQDALLGRRDDALEMRRRRTAARGAVLECVSDSAQIEADLVEGRFGLFRERPQDRDCRLDRSKAVCQVDLCGPAVAGCRSRCGLLRRARLRA